MIHTLAVLLLSLQVDGQTAVTDEDVHPIFNRMAETVVAMAAREGDPVLVGWTVAGLRARAVRWHLADPDTDDDWFHRTGWISETYQQVGVAACGGEDGVSVLSFEIHGESMAPLITALTPLGSMRREIEDGQEIIWFEAEGHAPSRITASVYCTPPGSAAARSCGTDIQVIYSADLPERACLAP